MFFELLITDEISLKYYTPDNQFGFKKGVGLDHAHHLISNLLLHAHENNEVLYFAGLDVSRAFDTGIHPHIFLTAYKHGVNPSVIKSIRDMYKKLNAKVKVTISPGTVELTPSIPVKKGIRQGAVTSPPLFNNTVIVPQQKVLTTCIFNGIDVSLANYADDILDISRTAFGIEENFGILDRE